VAPSKRRSTKKAPEASTSDPEPKAGDPGNVDQIRDILFGNQMRDYDQRFQRLEEEVRKELAELGSEMKSELARIEQESQKNHEELGEALGRETDQRKEASKKANADFKKTTTDLAAQLRKLEAKLDQRVAELRDQLLAQATALSEDIKKRDDRLSTALATSTRELDEAKMDRSTLARFLINIGEEILGGTPDAESD